MASLTTDLPTQFANLRDTSNYHSVAVGDFWMRLTEKTPEQHKTYKQIVRAQKGINKKLEKLHASLRETSDKLTRTILEQQSQLPEPDSPLPNITIDHFYEGLERPKSPTRPAHFDVIAVGPSCQDNTQQF